MALGAVRICRCCVPSTGRGGGCASPTPRQEQWGAGPGGYCRTGQGCRTGPYPPGCMLSRFQAAPFPTWMCHCSGRSTLSHERTRVFWRRFAKLWKNCLSKSGAHECSLREPPPLQAVFCTSALCFPGVTEPFRVPTAGAAPAVGGAAGAAGPGAAAAARCVWGPGKSASAIHGLLLPFPSQARPGAGPGNAFVPRVMNLAAA